MASLFLILKWTTSEISLSEFLISPAISGFAINVFTNEDTILLAFAISTDIAMSFDCISSKLIGYCW